LIGKLIMALSHGRRVDGLTIGILGRDRNDDPLLEHVETALMLIKQYDQKLYRQLHRDIKRIWIEPLLAASGSFKRSTGTCNLDYQHVKSSSAEVIASTIVHEASHAHPCLLKFGYPEALRYRIERICMRRQLAFAGKLPNGAAARAQVERLLALQPSYWLSDSLKKSRLQSGTAALREAGVPEWLITATLHIRSMLDWLRRRRS
jgi:hypothetical protein